jgi:two-component system, NarL family, invasion response regulator UvrY
MQTTTNRLRVCLADDHPLLMTGFAMALADHDVEVIGQSKTPEDAVAQYRKLGPDVLVLDIRFGTRKSGLDAAREILADDPLAKIVFLTQFDSDSLITEAYKLGGCAFITKDCEPSELAGAIRKAKHGETYFPPVIAQRLAAISVRSHTSPLARLEARELDVFKAMARGLTNAEIAEQMDLSVKTISNTSQSVKEKLGMERVADLTLLAVKHGLIEP